MRSLVGNENEDERELSCLQLAIYAFALTDWSTFDLIMTHVLTKGCFQPTLHHDDKGHSLRGSNQRRRSGTAAGRHYELESQEWQLHGHHGVESRGSPAPRYWIPTGSSSSWPRFRLLLLVELDSLPSVVCRHSDGGKDEKLQRSLLAPGH